MNTYQKQKIIELLKWIKHLDNGDTHYNPETKEQTISIGFSPYDCFLDNIKTEEELVDYFLKNY